MSKFGYVSVCGWVRWAHWTENGIVANRYSGQFKWFGMANFSENKVSVLCNDCILYTTWQLLKRKLCLEFAALLSVRVCVFVCLLNWFPLQMKNVSVYINGSSFKWKANVILEPPQLQPKTKSSHNLEQWRTTWQHWPQHTKTFHKVSGSRKLSPHSQTNKHLAQRMTMNKIH